jgi:branched-chain amino acid transport system substrate-binding protein
MFRIRWLVVALGTLSIVAAGVAATATARTGAAKFDCKGGAIVIGNAKGLTGPLAPFDGGELNGDKLAIAEINASGGIDGCKLRMTVGNTQSDPAVGRTVAQDLINKGAQILLVPGDLDLGITAAQAAQKAGIVSMSPTASTIGFPQAVGKLFFEGGLNTDDIGKAQAKYATQRNWKTVFLVTNKSFSFFTAQQATFLAHFKGKTVGSDVVTNPQQDYSGVVSKIAALKPQPDVVYGSTFFPNIGIFIKQLRQAGVKVPVLGSPGWASRDLPRVAGPANIQNSYYVGSVYFEGAGVDPDVAKMEAAYKKMFGKLPDTHNAILGYQSIYLLAKAMKQSGSTQGSALAGAISSVHNLHLTGSTIVGFPQNTASRSVAIVGFTKTGAFRKIASFIP